MKLNKPGRQKLERYLGRSRSTQSYALTYSVSYGLLPKPCSEIKPLFASLSLETEVPNKRVFKVSHAPICMQQLEKCQGGQH